MKPPDPCELSRFCFLLIGKRELRACHGPAGSAVGTMAEFRLSPIGKSNFDLGIPRAAIKSYAARRPVPPPAYEP